VLSTARRCNSFESQTARGPVSIPMRSRLGVYRIKERRKRLRAGWYLFLGNNCGRHHRRYKWPWLPAIHRVRQRSTWSFPFDCGVRPASTRRAGGITALKQGTPRLRTLSYGFALKEDRDAEEELPAGRDRHQAAASVIALSIPCYYGCASCAEMLTIFGRVTVVNL
jgi:hypothetical protein